MTMRIRKLIRWFIPIGYTIRLIKKYEARYYMKGVLSGYNQTIEVNSLWHTPFDGIYIVYSEKAHKEHINKKIERLNKKINQLERDLK